jgi:hypothetical protein
MRITVSGVQEMSEALLAAIESGVRNGLETIGNRGHGLVVEGAPVGAPTNLAHTVFAYLEDDGAALTEIITNGPPADVYGAPVEFGARPHFPPWEALIPWVKNKIPGAASDDQAARSIAFVIARKIARSGTQGAFMYRDAMQILEQEASGILERAIAESCAAAGF